MMLIMLGILLPFGALVASVNGIDLSRLYGHNGVQKRSGEFFFIDSHQKIDGLPFKNSSLRKDMEYLNYSFATKTLSVENNYFS